MASVQGATLQDKADKLTTEVVARWGEAVVVSDTEAEKMLASDFDNAENKALIKSYISELTSKNALMPNLFVYLMSDYQSGELNSGIRLELTKRLFREYLKAISINNNLLIFI